MTKVRFPKLKEDSILCFPEAARTCPLFPDPGLIYQGNIIKLHNVGQVH